MVLPMGSDLICVGMVENLERRVHHLTVTSVGQPRYFPRSTQPSQVAVLSAPWVGPIYSIEGGHELWKARHVRRLFDCQGNCGNSYISHVMVHVIHSL